MSTFLCLSLRGREHLLLNDEPHHLVVRLPQFAGTQEDSQQKKDELDAPSDVHRIERHAVFFCFGNAR